MAEKKLTEEVEIVVESDNHTQAGQLCKKGDKITVAPQTAKMLKEQWAKQAAKKS